MSRQETEIFPKDPIDWQPVANEEARTDQSRPSTLGILGKTYIYLGGGTFNWVYLSKKNERVVRIPREEITVASLDHPERLLRISKEILPKQFYDGIEILKETQYGDLLSAPYVSGVDANDAECASEVRRIFIAS